MQVYCSLGAALVQISETQRCTVFHASDSRDPPIGQGKVSAVVTPWQQQMEADILSRSQT